MPVGTNDLDHRPHRDRLAHSRLAEQALISIGTGHTDWPRPRGPAVVRHHVGIDTIDRVPLVPAVHIAVAEHSHSEIRIAAECALGQVLDEAFARNPALACHQVVRDVREADLDPVELFFEADANAAAERANIPAAIATGVDAGVARLQQAIPDAGEFAKRIAVVGALQKTLSALVGYATPIASLAAIAVLAIGFGAWRRGYGNGWGAANDRRLIGYDAYACRALANVHHTAAVQRRANAVAFVSQEMTARGCR